MKHGQRVCVRIVGQGIMVAQGYTPTVRSIKEKCVKKLDSRPELVLGCSQLRVWTPAGAKMDINMNKAVN